MTDRAKKLNGGASEPSRVNGAERAGGRIGDIDADYKSIVDRCHKRGLNHWISNLAPSHAAYLLHKLLRTAAKDGLPIRLISGCLDRHIYNHLTDELQDCIAAEAEITAVIVNGVDDAEENRFYRILREERSHARLLTVAPDYEAVADKVLHMLVVGDRAFRYELTPMKFKATANFNNPGTASLLIGFFEQWLEDGVFELMPAA